MFDRTIAQRIRLLGLDVDGVLTANDAWIGVDDGHPVEYKRFDIQDGFGLRLLRDGPIGVFWLTGRRSLATQARADELGIASVITVDPRTKVAALETLLTDRQIGWDEVAFVGDDIPDVPVLERVGLPIAVANARDEVKRIARYVTDARGGHGAVREVVDRLLTSRNEFDSAVRRFFATSSVPT
jgi:3-deoxy-D-manno-octulosonate 8-phosphate phosphatase (KDO 8-P phosphatase)